MTIATPLSIIAEKLRVLGDSFSREVLSSFFLSVPEARLIMPMDFPLADVVDFICRGADAYGNLYPETIEKLQEATVLLAAHGFRTYTPLADALIPVMRHHCLELGFYEFIVARQAIEQAADVMDKAVANCPIQPVTGQIVEVHKRSRNISVIRLITDTPIDYAPGQFLSINSDFAAGHWVNLCPSIPSNEAGQIEFHVHADGGASSALAASRPGDRIRIAAAGGGFDLDYSKDLLLIAHDTGLAAVRSIIIDLLMMSAPPHTHLFVSADYPGELYELQGLWQLASSAPWLFIKPIVRNETDEWWVGATDASRAPRGLHLMEVGRVGDLVSSFGTWEGHQIIIAGPEEIVAETEDALIRGGTPAENIQAQNLHSYHFWEQ